MKVFQILTLILAALAASEASSQGATDRRIQVTGVAEISALPDMATIQIGVTREARKASDAMRNVSSAIEGILSSLRQNDIQDRDIQTSRISLSPRWQSASSGSGARITGYVASNTVSIRLRDLGETGRVLDMLLDDGANTMGGLVFGLSEPGPIEDQARAAAVADAVGRANVLANAAGVVLGPIQSITDQSGTEVPQPMQAQRFEAMATSVPIAPGELVVTASVSIVFAIAD